MNSHVLYLSPTDSMHLFPGNTNQDFVVQFDKSLELGSACSIELLEFRCFPEKQNRETIYVLCDLCDNSTVLGMQAPVLRAVCLNNLRRISIEFANPYKIKASCSSARNCRVYLRGRDFQPLAFEVTDVEVTLRVSYHDRHASD